MIPRPANPARSAKTPRPITTMPADLKKRGAYREWANHADPNERSASIGKVPREKASMMSPPLIKDPLERAEICMDWVNPHGRKKVLIPIMRGVSVLCSILLRNWNIQAGRVIRDWVSMPTRLAPRSIMTSAANMPKRLVKRGLIPIACPSIPRMPHRRAKPTILPTWKRIKFFLSLTPSCDTFADKESTNHPTTAKQLDTEAIRPKVKLEAGVTWPHIPKLSIPDFCKRKKSISMASPRGRACQIISQSFSFITRSTERT